MNIAQMNTACIRGGWLKTGLLFCVLVLTARLAHADSPIYIKVGEAQIKKSLIAVPHTNFIGNKKTVTSHHQLSLELSKVINNDLENTGYFSVIKPAAFIEDPETTEPTPAPGTPNGFKFESWQQIGADFLVRTAFSVEGESLTLETYSYQVSTTKLILGKKYSSTLKNLRRVAHTFCNDLIKAMTGKEGMFLSKVAVSTDRGGGKSREIWTMDWDGAGAKQVTFHSSISLSPNWAPEGDKLIYTSFLKSGAHGARNADLVLLDLEKGTRKKLSTRTGVNSGGSFHPNGKSVFFTISEDGKADIFQVDLLGNILRKITNGPLDAVNVEPSVDPDGKILAFSSDRSGAPAIWIATMEGRSPIRRTTRGDHNSSPVWSPDGKYLAFAGKDGYHFDIFVMDANGENLRRLTEAKRKDGRWSSNEDPSFSPDGRHIMFTSDRTMKSQVFIVNFDGSDERAITHDNYSYYQPRWSGNFE